MKLKIDPGRANLAGITNRDVAASTTAAMSGTTVTTLREGNQQIPVIARLRSQERAQLSDVENLYVYSSQGFQKVSLRTVSSVANEMVTERIRRQEHFRTIGVHAFPQPGVLPSEILGRAIPQLIAFQKSMPAGYRMQIGGEKTKQESGFANLAKVLVISIIGIYAALLLQFGNAIKPFGAGSGALRRRGGFNMPGDHGIAFRIRGFPRSREPDRGDCQPCHCCFSTFRFHRRNAREGRPFEQAISDAGIERLRPVLITVCATILALFPLASHGGPLWQPLCYVQIGGLAVATFIPLLLVPVLYSIAVLDLKIVKWEKTHVS